MQNTFHSPPLCSRDPSCLSYDETLSSFLPHPYVTPPTLLQMHHSTAANRQQGEMKNTVILAIFKPLINWALVMDCLALLMGSFGSVALKDHIKHSLFIINRYSFP